MRRKEMGLAGKPWGDVNAIYQIYPRSFMDANSDGVGDLRGVIDKLDYLKGHGRSLGVDALWISPFYPSPMADFGYDVSDYCDVHPMFGTLDDFKELLEGAHARDLKVIVDFVPNHTSIEHPWFQEALRDPNSDKRDYYVWHEPVDGREPNNWVSIFGGSIWEYDQRSGQYYMHSFLKEQPDLNWENPRLRAEMKRILTFWLDLGVDGFRVDAVWHMAKDKKLRDEPKNEHYIGPPGTYGEYKRIYSKYAPELHDYLRELTDIVESYPNKIMVFETSPDEDLGPVVDQYAALYDVNPRIGLPFNFGGMFLPWGARPMGDFVRDFQAMLRPTDRPAYCFSNHDQPRIVSRFGRRQSRVVAMLLLTLPGLPTVYYGDEVGMENVPVSPHAMQDPASANNPMGGRDPERSPMQWTSGRYAGFSTHKPWLPVPISARVYNVALEQRRPSSIFALYKKLLALRRDEPVFRDGMFTELHNDERRNVLVYERRGADKAYRVALNFSGKCRRVKLGRGAKVVCFTYPNRRPFVRNGTVLLGPYEGVVARV